MMNVLLKNDFIAHYSLGKCKICAASTKDENFGLIDDTTIFCSQNEGIARYSNTSRKEVMAINYERFINSLSGAFQQGREKCDILIYTADYSHFILNELTDTAPEYIPDFKSAHGILKTGKRNKAIAQLTKTLIDISAVPSILRFLNRHAIRRCCFFNKQINAPHGITATIAFNRLSTLSPNGYQMPDQVIESHGFEFWEFSGNQICELSSLKAFIKIKQVKSRIGMPLDQKRTLDALGLRKLNRVVEHEPTPSILGMIDKVKHLVTIIE